jgi:hypothetical protein
VKQPIAWIICGLVFLLSTVFSYGSVGNWTNVVSQTVSSSTAEYHHEVTVYYQSGSNSSTAIYTSGNCETDFSDVRFIDQDLMWMSFYIESVTASSFAKFVIKVPAESTRIFCLYGNSELSGDTYKIGLVADGHYSDTADIELPNCQKSTQCLNWLGDFKDDMDSWSPDLVGMLGDMIDNNREGEHTDEEWLELLEDVEDYWQTSTAGNFDDATKLHVVGNHEFLFGSLSDVRAVIAANYDYFETDLLYGSFDDGDYHIIVLDSEYESDGTHADDENLLEGYIGPSQLGWLESDLIATDKKSIVFVHRQAAPSYVDDHWKDGAEAYTWLTDANTLKDMLHDSGKVIAIFCGHTHWYRNDHKYDMPYIDIPALTCYNCSGRPYEARPRLYGNEMDQGIWAKLTLDDTQQLIKIEIYEDDSGGGEVTAEHYTYYNSSIDRIKYGAASNPLKTFDFGYSLTSQYRSGYCGDVGRWGVEPDWSSGSDIHVLTNDLDTINTSGSIQAIHLWADTGESTIAEAQTRIPSQSGLFKVKFRIRFEQTDKNITFYVGDDIWNFTNRFTTSYAGPVVLWNKDGILQYYNSSSTWTDIIDPDTTYSTDTWYDIELRISITDHDFDIYIDGSEKANSLEFHGGSISELDCLSFRKGNSSDAYPVNYYVQGLHLERLLSSPPNFGTFSSDALEAVDVDYASIDFDLYTVFPINAVHDKIFGGRILR